MIVTEMLRVLKRFTLHEATTYVILLFLADGYRDPTDGVYQIGVVSTGQRIAESRFDQNGRCLAIC